MSNIDAKNKVKADTGFLGQPCMLRVPLTSSQPGLQPGCQPSAARGPSRHGLLGSPCFPGLQQWLKLPSYLFPPLAVHGPVAPSTSSVGFLIHLPMHDPLSGDAILPSLTCHVLYFGQCPQALISILMATSFLLLLAQVTAKCRGLKQHELVGPQFCRSAG